MGCEWMDAGDTHAGLGVSVQLPFVLVANSNGGDTKEELG